MGSPATLPVGSIRVTVPSPALATHTKPAPTSSTRGSRPTAIGSPTTAAFAGSIRVIVPSPAFATHVQPSPTATPRGWRPTLIGSPPLPPPPPARGRAVPPGELRAH